MEYEWIDFADGRCRRLRSTTHQGRADEAIEACGATFVTARLLDSNMNRVATLEYDPSINGWVISPV